MKIETFKNMTIAYMRNTGEYGPNNEKLMDKFKEFLETNKLFNDKTTILGIALDNPKITPKNNLRYDVGIILTKEMVIDLPTRKIADGDYAIYDVEHTKKGIIDFWNSLPQLVKELPIDNTKPIIERYTMQKIKKHHCEFCIPLK